MKLLALFAVLALAYGALPNDDLAVVKQAQLTLLKETNSAKIAFFGPQEKLVGEKEFQEFQVKYGKSYSSIERAEKLRTFQVNMYMAARYQRFELGSAKYGMTQFSDLTVDEFKRYYRNAHFDLKPAQEAQIPAGDAPASVDWRTKGAVTPVKNQGQCGSCWAFSTTGNIEGQWFLKKGSLVSLSEQELVDCDKVDQGCNGGLPSQAYKEIERLGGLVKETDYPYTGRDGSCSLKKTEEVVYINNSLAISTNEDDMAKWTAANGPISIGINAAAMQFYFGGISHPFSILCSPSNLDHGVLIVGYDTTSKGEPYWIVKNSWGPSWGEKGYYLVYRGSGVCGLNKMPTSAVVA